jgi:phosphoenolpyruvate carboxylase
VNVRSDGNQGGGAEGSRGDAERTAAADAALERLLSGLEPGLAFEVVRAFSAYFGLANMAERVHRIRRRVDNLRAGEAQRGGFRAVLETLAARGHTLADLRARLAGLQDEPVFTAHPTQAERRSLLEMDLRIARALVPRLHL